MVPLNKPTHAEKSKEVSKLVPPELNLTKKSNEVPKMLPIVPLEKAKSYGKLIGLQACQCMHLTKSMHRQIQEF